MSTPTMDEAAKVLADPTAYADEPRLHAALTHLRANAPVAWVDQPPYRPFWAITKHADIMAIERANDLFISEPRPLLSTAEADDLARAQLEAGMGLRTLIHMDDPQHRVMRAIGADWFRPKAMRALKVRVDELARIYIDKMRDVGPECDFVTDVAMNFPLYVIMSLLGLPESDFPRMLKLTREMFGGDDEELQRGTTPEEQLAVLVDFFGYFSALTAARREQPTEDLASAVANARIEIECSRLLTLKAAYMMDTVGNKVARAEIAMIKVKAPNIALQIIDDAIQAFGGAGVTEDFGLARTWASMRTLRLADGPDEVHRRTIARIEFKKQAERAGISLGRG